MAASKKHPGGRPPKYSSPQEMQEKIDAYFVSCQPQPLTIPDLETGKPQVMVDKNGRPIYEEGRPPTVTGLALALGFASRSGLLGYQGKASYQEMIQRAKSRVEQYTEERLFDRDGVQGAKFSLANNFIGWMEKQETRGDMDLSVKLELSPELEELAK